MQQSSWELTILAFAMMLTVMLGASYVLGAMYRITVPWPLLPLVSLAFAALVRRRRR
ncbi:MAG: hypothetical protein KGS47_03885 [Chloroflexi bacterium]|jgi:uncharacterized protein (TIGR03382 family)|nr:hypothetical protein [Chloroflexota bacterium]